MKLLPLRCPSCRHLLPVENDDVLVDCAHCCTAVLVDDDGVRTAEVRFAVSATAPAQDGHWLPYWVFHGRVHIQQRETQGGGGWGILAATPEAESSQLWGSDRYLYVPAWRLPLHEAQAIGSDLIQLQPAYAFIDRPESARLQPAAITAADAGKIVEFIVLAIEARRKDWLKRLAFELELGPGQLWALPAGGVRWQGARRT
jgi:hypothetical protein